MEPRRGRYGRRRERRAPRTRRPVRKRTNGMSTQGPRPGRLWIANGILVNPRERDVDVRPGSILIRDGKIADIRPVGSPLPGDAQVLDATDRIIIPGLVNAHVHSHGVLSKWAVDGLPLEIWSPYVAAGRAGLTVEEARLGALLVGIECLRHGVTAVLDHPVYDAPCFDAAAEAYLEVGIRAALAPSVMDLPYYVTIPRPRAEVPDALRSALWAGPQPSVQSLLDFTVRCIERWQGAKERLSVLVGPSAPQRCSTELLAGLARTASECHVHVHTHLLETKGQALMAERLYGVPITRYLDQVGLLTEALSVAHAVWVGEEDIRRLAECGVTVVHNPLSNLTLGSGVMPLLALRASGVRLALGTDSPNSGGHHELFESMRMAAALPRAFEPDPDLWVTAEETFRWATLGGARAAGLADRIGAIEVGKAADLVLLKRRTSTLTPLNHLIRQLVFCERGESVETVLVGGRIVVRSGRLLTLDEETVLKEAESLGERLLKRNRPSYEEARRLEAYTRLAYAVVQEAAEPTPPWGKRIGASEGQARGM